MIPAGKWHNVTNTGKRTAYVTVNAIDATVQHATISGEASKILIGGKSSILEVEVKPEATNAKLEEQAHLLHSVRFNLCHQYDPMLMSKS